MLQNPTILVGKWYVNHARMIAREVLGGNEATVIFNTYHLDTGNSSGIPSECGKEDFIQWADHEATPSELTRLQMYNPRLSQSSKRASSFTVQNWREN